MNKSPSSSYATAQPDVDVHSFAVVFELADVNDVADVNLWIWAGNTFNVITTRMGQAENAGDDDAAGNPGLIDEVTHDMPI